MTTDQLLDKLEHDLHEALDHYITENGLDEGEAAVLQRMITDLLIQAKDYADD